MPFTENVPNFSASYLWSSFFFDWSLGLQWIGLFVFLFVADYWRFDARKTNATGTTTTDWTRRVGASTKSTRPAPATAPPTRRRRRPTTPLDCPTIPTRWEPTRHDPSQSRHVSRLAVSRPAASHGPRSIFWLVAGTSPLPITGRVPLPAHRKRPLIGCRSTNEQPCFASFFSVQSLSGWYAVGVFWLVVERLVAYSVHFSFQRLKFHREKSYLIGAFRRHISQVLILIRTKSESVALITFFISTRFTTSFWSTFGMQLCYDTFQGYSRSFLKPDSKPRII